MKSSVDWCELNYSSNAYIAEFYNTITGVFISISSVCFYYKCNEILRHVPSHFKNVQLLLHLVSIGTMLFHGTLLYPFQLLDELPMLMIAMQYLNFVSLLNQSTFQQKTFPINKEILIVIATSYFIHPMLQQTIFHISLKYYEINIIYGLYNLSKQLNLNAFSTLLPMKAAHTEPMKNLLYRYILLRKKTSWHIKLATMFYTTSMILWFLDQTACSHVEFLKLHAIWHILSSIGIYQLNMVMLNHHLINRLLKSI